MADFCDYSRGNWRFLQCLDGVDVQEVEKAEPFACANRWPVSPASGSSVLSLALIAMKTKFYVRFLNRAAHLDADIEVVDVAALANQQGRLHSAPSKYLFDFVTPMRHPRLANRTNTDHNRGLAFGHLKGTLCASFLKDAYEDVTTYLRDVLEAAAKNGLDPNRLIGDHKQSFEANELLACKGWDSVVRLVSIAVFRKLENERSTKDLLVKFNIKLNLGVAQAKIDAALPYLEMRHLLVHADGVADQTFCSGFPSIGATAGQKVPLNYTVLTAARKAIFDMVAEFDVKVVQHNVVSAADMQP